MSHPNYREMLGELGKPVLSGEIWQAFTDAIRWAGEVVTAPGAPSSPMDRGEGYRYLTRLLNAALTMYVEFADPDYPEFGRLMDTSIKWGSTMLTASTRSAPSVATQPIASAAADFGFGKYTNRNVMDAYAGVSRGVEQWTVRASCAVTLPTRCSSW